METYARCIVMRRWSSRPDEPRRPHASFDTLREAVEYVEFAMEDDGGRRERSFGATWDYSIVDVEHIDMGDMLKARDCAALVARIIAEYRGVRA